MTDKPKRWHLPLAKVLTLTCTLACLTVAVEARSEANDMTALLKDRGCYACHDMTETLIGPSYHAIEELHRTRKNVMVEVLAHKIVVGGAGNWGLVPMVPNEHVTEDEAREMAEWILNQQLPK